MRTILAGLVLLGILGCGRTGAYPNRPVTIICPWAQGGGTDRVSKQLAHLLKQDLGVPVDVKNAVGGEGVTGHSQGARARPDGYTLTMMTVELNILHWRGFTALSPKDFIPTVLLNEDAAAVFVRGDAEARTLKDLQDRIRKGGRRLKAAGTARGAIWHLATVGWLQAAGLPQESVLWQSMDGSMPSLTELLAGGVDFVCCSLPEARSFLDGRVRCLGVMDSERVPSFPDVPTLKEQGVDYAMRGWRGIGLPLGTPPDVVRRVVEALERVVRSDAFEKYMQAEGFNRRCDPPDVFAATLERMDGEMGKIVAAPAFKAAFQGGLGPMFFPATLALALIVVIVPLAAGGGFRKNPEAEVLDRRGKVRFAEVVAAVVVYLLVAETAGFILTAGALVAALLWRMGVRPWVSVAIGACFSPTIYLIFNTLLRVPLPVGWVGWS